VAGDDLILSRMSFFMASKLRDGYIRKLSVIYDECRMNRGSGHRNVKTTVEAGRGGAERTLFGFWN